MSTSGWAGDFLDPVTFLDLFVSGGGNNWTGWGDTAYDRMIEEAARTRDPRARLEVFQGRSPTSSRRGRSRRSIMARIPT